jgi:predicted naringenin-chalcone synthase
MKRGSHPARRRLEMPQSFTDADAVQQTDASALACHAARLALRHSPLRDEEIEHALAVLPTDAHAPIDAVLAAFVTAY